MPESDTEPGLVAILARAY